MDLDNAVIGVVGLGYVGLPLAVEFGKKRHVVGFDIRDSRVRDLREGRDSTREVDAAELREASFLEYSSDAQQLKKCKVFIAAVPTPVDQARRPDLTVLRRATETIAAAIVRHQII